MTKEKPTSLPAALGDTPVETTQQRGELMFTHYDGKKIQATIENMRDLLRYYKIICRYNVISKKVHHIIPTEEFTPDNEEEAALACIFSYMKQWSMATDGYKGYLLRISDENQYNPVLEWVRSIPWDRISRIKQFCDTIESPEPEAKYLLIRRWLITAMSMALQHGVDSAGCLVLQGPQDIGKTWWVKKLVPDEIRGQLVRTGATVDPHDKDSVSQVISYWICELGEIGATFRKSDLDALKGFITRDHDVMRRPYAMSDSKYPRRTALIASVDQMIYLYDTAGNRRFWTIPCTAINSYHEVDMQQLWAEVLDLIERRGESWQLQPDEKEHIRRINEEHMQIDPIMEMIQNKYKWDEFMHVSDWKTATEIAQDLGLKSITVKETRVISGHILKLNENQRRQSGSKKLLKVPATKGF